MAAGLRDIVDYLNSCKETVELAPLRQLLLATEISRQDISSHIRFLPDTYSRNLVTSSKWFELLVLCWHAGHKSQIHDHAGSGCAFKIISGAATEVKCELTGRVSEKVKLVRPVSLNTYPVGSVCASRSEDIHKIVNGGDGDLITVHIYSPPLNMNTYKFDPAEQAALAKFVPSSVTA